MTRFERQQLENRRHMSRMIPLFAIVFLGGVCIAIVALSFNF